MSPYENSVNQPNDPVSGTRPSDGLIHEWRSFAGAERVEVVALCAVFVVVFWSVVLFAGFSPFG
jgi:hypothetical protein